MALLFDSLEDLDEYKAYAEAPGCPHCDGVLHGPTTYCFCAGCDACARARFFRAFPGGERPLPAAEALELFEATFGYKSHTACFRCEGEGWVYDEGYCATEGHTRPGPAVTCFECDGSGELRIEVDVVPAAA